MTKSATLIASALMTVGFAAGAMAADMPKSAAPMAADAPAASGTGSTASKPAKKHKKHKKAKASTAPSST